MKKINSSEPSNFEQKHDSLASQKRLEYAEHLLDDLSFCTENEEEPIIEKRDILTIHWLIEQAKMADMYRTALTHIASTPESSDRAYAIQTLREAEHRFSIH